LLFLKTSEAASWGKKTGAEGENQTKGETVLRVIGTHIDKVYINNSDGIKNLLASKNEQPLPKVFYEEDIARR
jgi:hypothetical protein